MSGKISKVFRLGAMTLSVAAAALALSAQQPPAPPQPVVESPAPVEPQVIDVEHGEDGLTRVSREPRAPAKVEAPGDSVELGQPTRFTIDVGDRKVLKISASQAVNDKEPGKHGVAQTPRTSDVKIVGESGTERTLEIIPMELGKVDVTLYIGYADGKLVQQARMLNVSASPKGLTRFYIFSGQPAMSLTLGGNKEDGQARLLPGAFYSTLKYPVQFTDASEVRLTVAQFATAPVIHVDKDGLVHGLRPGKAVITGSFGGKTDHVTVLVYPKAHATAWDTHSAR